MGSATVAIQVVGVQHDVVEFWAAELPRGADGPFAVALGGDPPAFALTALADSGGALAALGLALHDAAWAEAHAGDFIASMELVAAVALAGRPAAPIARQIQSASDVDVSLRLAVGLAPRALYRVTVRDPVHLAHLRRGQCFGSVACSPQPPVARVEARQLVTPQGWAPILEVMRADVDPARVHVIRRFERPPVCLLDTGDIRVSNELRELFLRLGGAMYACFDATVPRFNPARFPFSPQKMIPAPVAQMALKGHPAGPHGWDLSVSFMRRDPDGVARARLDTQLPGVHVKWVEVEGTPLVRSGDFTAADPRSPGVGLETYLRDSAARVRAVQDGR